VTIPNGVDLNKFKNQRQKNENTSRKLKTVLSVGAFTAQKRQNLAIKAVAQLENVSLILVGQGELKSYLEKLGQRLLPGRFKITSFEYQDMPQVYRAADLFTFPTSPWESFGIVLVEAMAAGLPVVATDDPIRREIVWRSRSFC